MRVARVAPQPVSELAGSLGVPVSAELLDLAITHRSFSYENGGVPTNERLEFLGDAVLGVIVTDVLYHRHPDVPEGQLAKLRAAVVNARALAEVSRALGIGSYLKLGRGEEISGGRDKTSILADALEAVIGAVYLDRGIDVTRSMLLRLFLPVLDGAADLGAGLDWKTSLQELAATRSLGVASYRVSESGPDHLKEFQADVLLGDEVIGTGAGLSKKQAEQDAAAAAWQALSAAPPPPGESKGKPSQDEASGDEAGSSSAQTVPDQVAGQAVAGAS